LRKLLQKIQRCQYKGFCEVIFKRPLKNLTTLKKYKTHKTFHRFDFWNIFLICKRCNYFLTKLILIFMSIRFKNYINNNFCYKNILSRSWKQQKSMINDYTVCFKLFSSWYTFLIYNLMRGKNYLKIITEKKKKGSKIIFTLKSGLLVSEPCHVPTRTCRRTQLIKYKIAKMFLSFKRKLLIAILVNPRPECERSSN
jgi:hypothetical protein